MFPCTSTFRLSFYSRNNRTSSFFFACINKQLSLPGEEQTIKHVKTGGEWCGMLIKAQLSDMYRYEIRQPGSQELSSRS